MTNMLINYLGLGLGVLSILATIYFAIRYSEKKDPRFYSFTENRLLVSKQAPEEIEVKYKGEIVPRIACTKVWFWNAGKKAIKREDVPDAQPISIELDDERDEVKILEVGVRKMTRAPINFIIDKTSDKSAALRFDFLDHLDGAAIEVFHTGDSRTTCTISGIVLGARGGIKGVSAGSRRAFFPLLLLPWTNPVRRRASFAARMLATALLFILMSVFATIVLIARGEVTTTDELLHSSLKSYVAPDKLDLAVSKVIDNGRYKIMNSSVPFVLLAITVINLIVGMIVLWRPTYPFPTSLLFQNTPRRSNEAQDRSGNP